MGNQKTCRTCGWACWPRDRIGRRMFRHRYQHGMCGWKPPPFPRALWWKSDSVEWLLGTIPIEPDWDNCACWKAEGT